MEMMIALAVLGAATAITVEVGSGVRSEQRQADAAARDLTAASKALRLAAEDVRASRYDDARWSLSGDTLSRGEDVVARGVRSWGARVDGPVTRLEITVTRRSFDPGTVGTLTSSLVVRPRAKEAP